jgi:hypothetical protein
MAMELLMSSFRLRLPKHTFDPAEGRVWGVGVGGYPPGKLDSQ